MKTAKEKSGFFDLHTEKKICNNPDHKVPTGISIPKGKGYKHVCPACGEVTIVTPSQTTL